MGGGSLFYTQVHVQPRLDGMTFREERSVLPFLALAVRRIRGSMTELSSVFP
jgi:hypothetical protein